MADSKCLDAMTSAAPVPAPVIENRILLVRGQRVLLDSDLAELYEVPTKALNQAVKRNAMRFPDDFMFRLTLEEGRHINLLRSQNVTLEIDSPQTPPLKSQSVTLENRAGASENMLPTCSQNTG